MNEVNKADDSVQDLSTPSDTSKWMKWTKLMLLSKICLHRRTPFRRVRRCRQILDRSISFVHFTHLDVPDGVDKSWTETRLNEWSEQSLWFCPRFSTPSDTSKWMKWTKLMLLSKICLHRRTRLNEWSEQSLCFCPRFIYTVGHMHKLCLLHPFRRVRRCRQILDRSISFVHFTHLDVPDGVDKSWTET
jgi:hypothetical protein